MKRTIIETKVTCCRIKIGMSNWLEQTRPRQQPKGWTCVYVCIIISKNSSFCSCFVFYTFCGRFRPSHDDGNDLFFSREGKVSSL